MKSLSHVKKEINYHKRIEKKYFKFANLYKKNFTNELDFKKKERFIKRYKIQLLGIKRKNAINRFFFELKSFLKFIEQNKIKIS